MQLRGLEVHFQEDAELMRGAGPCGCLGLFQLQRREWGPCLELQPPPPKSWVSRVQSTASSPGGLVGGAAFPVELLPLLGSCAFQIFRGGLWEGAGTMGPQTVLRDASYITSSKHPMGVRFDQEQA